MNAVDRTVDNRRVLVAPVPGVVQPVIQQTTVTEPESAATIAVWAPLTVGT
jgi:hypothetical protein